MRRVWTTIVFLETLLAGGLRGDDPPQTPADPQAVLVELTLLPDGLEQEPDITVFANGRVRVKVGEGAIWGQLPASEVPELLHKLNDVDGLAQVSSESVQQSILRESSRTGLAWRIGNADETRIALHTNRGCREIQAHAVGLLATRFPEAEDLQKVDAAQRRLENVRAVVMAGGPESAGKLAAVARQRLQAEYGEEIPVTAENLTMVRTLDDGTRCCQFVVRSNSGGKTTERIVSLVQSPGETPRVSLFGDGPALR